MNLPLHLRKRRCQAYVNRRGQSLILIFFVMIALVGVLALILDYGFVLLARRHMQTGVNAAALEGLRDIGGQGRQNAMDLMRNIYDDDLDPRANYTTIGAGIDKSLIQGDGYRSMTIGAGNGLPVTLANRSQYIYRPNPELNLDNEVHGDFVRGDFVPGQQPKEYPTYDRDGFTPNAPGNAFLSRLRRTRNAGCLDQVPGVSSSAGGLPLIIGHLAWFAASPRPTPPLPPDPQPLPPDPCVPNDPDDPKGAYSIRRDGVTVRATAIAHEQVVVRVWEVTSNEVYSALPFVTSVTDLTAFHRCGTTLTSVGQPIPVVPPLVPATPIHSGYVAVYANILGQDRVIGFYFHQLNPSAQPRLPNASARLQDAWFESGLTEEIWRHIRIRQNEPSVANPLIPVREYLLKAPVLVRSIR